MQNKPIVAILMGSSSDWSTMKLTAEILEKFNIKFEAKVVSAHRMPDEMFEYAEQAYNNGIKVIIAGAGGAAHLPGMLAAKTLIPVLGVPIASKYLSGKDSLYSIVQMPKGIPVGTLAIGDPGASNAALLAISILALNDAELYQKLINFRLEQTQCAKDMQKNLI